MSTELVHYDAACRAISIAKTVDEVREIRDQSAAMKAYARQAKNRQLEADAVEIRFRAERRIGQLMQAQRESVGLNHGTMGSPVKGARVNNKPTLLEAGIDKNLAHQARILSRQDDASFEQTVAEVRAGIDRAVRTVIRSVDIEQAREPYRNAIAEGCTVSDLNTLAASGYRAKVIYADPPWAFQAYSGKGKQRAAERHYDTQSLADIMALGPSIDAIAAEDCVLLLWAVMPELRGALAVIDAWGFTYKTVAFVWVKTAAGGQPMTGMGYWSRANAELCLLATRGAPQRISKDVHQVVMAPRGEHSAKPDEVASRIERLVPGPYLELFARKTRPGWQVWGNEVPASWVAV